MQDEECVHFLQWALPRLSLQWAGFRKVRRQVCKRIQRRIKAIDLADTNGYRKLLQADKEEWQVLEKLCRITVSRFFRDRKVFDYLGSHVLPELARDRIAAGDAVLQAWSAGCGSGEEPYSLALLWEFQLKPEFPDLRVTITATDSDAKLLKRADEACYPHGCLKELPDEWRVRAFEQSDSEYCLRSTYQENVQFVCQDLRRKMPDRAFDLILCRNLAFTYFDDSLQQRMCHKLVELLVPGGALVIGRKEILPDNGGALKAWSESSRVYRRTAN